MMPIFIACQLFVVLFIALHDWIPLAGLNNLRAVHSADPKGKLVVVPDAVDGRREEVRVRGA
jgi:hypothetical protein